MLSSFQVFWPNKTISVKASSWSCIHLINSPLWFRWNTTVMTCSTFLILSFLLLSFGYWLTYWYHAWILSYLFLLSIKNLRPTPALHVLSNVTYSVLASFLILEADGTSSKTSIYQYVTLSKYAVWNSVSNKYPVTICP
jgi:hypothetical protein